MGAATGAGSAEARLQTFGSPGKTEEWLADGIIHVWQKRFVQESSDEQHSSSDEALE